MLTRQADIERRLAKRRLKEGTLVLYDLTSVYLEGRRCPLAQRGHSRDGKRSKLQIEFGLLCDAEGGPVAVEVFKGNAADPMTVGAQIKKLKDRFGLKRVVLVGDRGMLTEARIREEVKPAGLDWIGALRSSAIRALVESGAVQMSLFDETDLIEVRSDAYPGERLMVCRQSAAGQRALAQARGPAASDREVARSHRGGHKAREEPLERPGQDRPSSGQGHRQIQDGQALRSRDQGRILRLPARRRGPSPAKRPWTACMWCGPACRNPNSTRKGRCAPTSA